MTREEIRLRECEARTAHWQRWGPYLAERQWGTVREDYSDRRHGLGRTSRTTTRARAPTAGARTASLGICDDHGRLCFALALWNGSDPILKERLFGLTGNEGNHGEDVKEYYFYLDTTPTHSYMKCLYKYPQRASPTPTSSTRTAAATGDDPEFELLDTGVFDDDRYFDVVVEYAKAGARRHSDPDQRHQPRPRRRAELAPACRRSGSATPGLVEGSGRRRARADRARDSVAMLDALVEAAHVTLGERWL